VQLATCDGKVQFISENVDLTIWRRLGDKADGQPVGRY
jgi:hypothetical protein